MKFPSLPAASALTGTEIIPLTQGGVDKRSIVQTVRNFPESKAANKASASTVDLATATGPYVSITGTTTITALGTVQAGAMFTLHFQGALTLTHNAASLILPGSTNIVTAAGDIAVFRSEGAGNWRCVGYLRSNGLPLAVALDTDGTLAANSDSKLATQKAVKTYVDGIVAAMDAMVFKGVIDCSANPNYPAADRGWTYRVSVAGKIGGAAGVNVTAGDILTCLTDGTAAGDQATVGAAWTIIQANLDGALTTADIGVTVQAYSADLSALSSFMGGLLSSADAAAARATLDAAKSDVVAVRNTVSAVTSSAGAAEIDYALGDYFTFALSEDITDLTFANLPGAGKGCTIMAEITQDTTPRDIAWPASFTWANGLAGALSTAAGAVDVLALTTFDNGTTWRATLAPAFA